MLAYAVCSPTCDPIPDGVDSIDWIQESLVQECVVLGVRTKRIVECWKRRRRRRLNDSVEDDDDDSGFTGTTVVISVLGIVFVGMLMLMMAFAGSGRSRKRRDRINPEEKDSSAFCGKCKALMASICRKLYSIHRAVVEKADRFWKKVDRWKRERRRKRRQKVQPQSRHTTSSSGKRSGSQKRTRRTDVIRGDDEGGGTDARMRKTEVQTWGDEGGGTETRVWKPEARADGQGKAPAFQGQTQAPAATMRNKSMRPIPDDEWFMQYEGIMKAAGGGAN